MVPAWLPPAEEIPQLVAGILMLSMAGGFLLLRFSDRLHQALALYLVLAGTREVLGSLDDPVSAPTLTAWVFHTIPWFDIALPFAALFLALRLHERERKRKVGPTGPFVLLGAAALILFVFVLYRPADAGDYAGYVTSPFILFYAGLPPLLAWIGWYLARGLGRSTEDGAAAGLSLACLGFTLHAAFVMAVGYRYFYNIAGLEALSLGVILSALVPVVLVGRRLHVTGSGLWKAQGVVFLLSCVYVAADAWVGVRSATYALVEGGLRVGLPVLLGHSVLRHRFLDIDLRFKRTMSRSTVGGSFVAVFFLVAEVMQNLFSDRLGWWLGGIAAGLLLLALHPLQRMAERLATHTLLDGDRAGGDLDLFRQAVRDAWADGTLGRGERRVLEGLRARLGISAEQAAQVESEVLDAA